ncbi:MAG TPA: aminotransferase class V-fold PLP-dependent enzyme, partial [Planctomycetaceae bacterium]|nr:aminotransferase class V-fold PLP-dependent enzyme [Planctomycetaceae bacterium]
MYFDNAATSFPKPECVYDAADACMRGGAAAAGRGTHRNVEAAGQLIDDCRRQLATLLGVAAPSHVVFTLNCTDSLNTVLQGFLNPGDRVAATALDHNSVLRPLEALKSRIGIEVEIIPFDPVTGVIDVARYSEVLATGNIRLVVLNQASNVTGRVQPVAELTRIAHDHGASVLLDAAQTAGHWPVSMTELDVDFLAAAGHKGLLGPLGTGVLCLRPGLETHVWPLRFGGTGTSSESLVQPDEMPARFEGGNLNLPGIAGLHAASKWILDSGVEKLCAQIHATTLRLSDQLSRIDKVRVLEPCLADDNCGIVSFNIEDMDCRDVAMILDQSFDIQSRAGLHCAPLAHQTLQTNLHGGTIRLCPGVFTTGDNVAHVIHAVQQIAEHS